MAVVDVLKFSNSVQRFSQARELGRSRILNLQARRLCSLLQYASDHSIYYRKRLQNIDLRSPSLQEIAPTTKQEMREKFEAIVTDRRLRIAELELFMKSEENLGKWFQDRYAVSHTSGSQGPPLPIVQDRRSVAITLGLFTARSKSTENFNLFEGFKKLSKPERIAILTFKRGFYPSASIFEFAETFIGPFAKILRLSAFQKDCVEQILKFKPNKIVGYPSSLEALATQFPENGLPELRAVSTSGEHLSPETRTLLERRFGTSIQNHYGVGECLFIGDQCPLNPNVLHINEDWTIIENVDENYRPVDSGELGSKVLVTNLVNFTQPFIRYEVGDRLKISTKPCECGSPFASITQIVGRNSEVLWFEKNGRREFVTGVLLHSAADEVDGIREWQAIQIDNESIYFQLLADGNVAKQPNALKAEFREKLISLGFPEFVTIEIRFANSITPDLRTGKVRRIIPLDKGEPAPSSNIKEGALRNSVS